MCPGSSMGSQPSGTCLKHFPRKNAGSILWVTELPTLSLKEHPATLRRKQIFYLRPHLRGILEQRSTCKLRAMLSGLIPFIIHTLIFPKSSTRPQVTWTPPPEAGTVHPYRRDKLPLPAFSSSVANTQSILEVLPQWIQQDNILCRK